MKQVIVVWQSPDDIDVYSLCLNDDDFKKICNCHGRIINVNEWDEQEWVSDFLVDKPTVPMVEALPMQINGTLVVTGWM